MPRSDTALRAMPPATHTVCGRYPLKVNGVWRSTCSKHPAHWWQPVSAPAGSEATR